jgi:hypothetical protein
VISTVILIHDFQGRNVKRRHYNRKLKGTFFNIAFTASRINPLALSYYQRKRKEDKSHRQALLCLARQYVRIVYAVWKKRISYIANMSN